MALETKEDKQNAALIGAGAVAAGLGAWALYTYYTTVCVLPCLAHGPALLLLSQQLEKILHLAFFTANWQSVVRSRGNGA